jgi:hypothetical protein
MSNNLGLRVMIGLLSGNESSVEAFTPALGKKISSLTLSDNAIHFVMADGYKMKLWDNGQSCCEQRYMSTDDDLNSYIGSTLMGG